MKGSTINLKIFYILTFACLLKSFMFYYFWHVSNFILDGALILALIPLAIGKKKFMNFTVKNLIWFMIFLLSYLFVGLSATGSIITTLLGFVPIVIIMNLNVTVKEDLLNFVIKAMALMILISLCYWTLYLLKIPLPHNFVTFGETKTGEAHYVYDNYYLFLRNVGYGASLSVFPRFCFMFLEPGYFACLSFVLLFINGLTLKKKENIVLLVGILMSFSLAGYILLAIGYMYYFYIMGKLKPSNILLIVLVTAGAYIYITSTDNILNRLIVARLEYDDSRSSISGYNRSKLYKLDVSTYLDQWDISEWCFGDPRFRKSSYADGVDWKTFMLKYGIVCILVYLFFLYYPISDKKYKFPYLSLMCMFALILAQTIHGAYWAMYPSLYILGVNKLNLYGFKPVVYVKKKAHITYR